MRGMRYGLKFFSLEDATWKSPVVAEIERDGFLRHVVLEVVEDLALAFQGHLGIDFFEHAVDRRIGLALRRSFHPGRNDGGRSFERLDAEAVRPEIPALVGEADLGNRWPVSDLELDIDADLRQLLLHHGRDVDVGAEVVDDESELLALVAGLRQRSLGCGRIALPRAAVAVIGRAAIDPAEVELVDVRIGDRHDLFRIKRERDRAAEVHIRPRRLRMVELDHLQPERQHGNHLEVGVALQAFRGRAVGRFVEMRRAGFDRRIARARFGNKAEGDGIDIDHLRSGEAVAFLVCRIGRVIRELLDLHMAVGLVFDELERPGADGARLAHRFCGLFGRHDGDRRARARQVAEEGRLHALQLDGHFVRAARRNAVSMAPSRVAEAPTLR